MDEDEDDFEDLDDQDEDDFDEDVRLSIHKLIVDWLRPGQWFGRATA